MKILCLNTAFSETYVSVQNENLQAEKTMDSSLKQSENVLGAVDECLNKTNLQIKDLDVISCVIGPGSFTGIRIGASLVKGFCAPYPNVKKVQINSLDLLAYTYTKLNKPAQDFYVVLNGLSGNIFTCKYNKNGEQLTQPQLMFGDEILTLKGTVVGLKQEEYSICNQFVEFNTSDLLEYTRQKVENNEYSQDFTPLYLRKSQAEAELSKKNGNC